jgi:L-amino acid N-acyltransferase YncA
MIRLEKMKAQHWTEVSNIYLAGITTGNATFETKCPSWESWDKSHRSDCRIVAIMDDKVVGWAALSNVSDRCVYAGVGEVSVYVDPAYGGKGIGTELMKRLIEESELSNIWTLQAGIFPENTASIKLHQKMGFRIIGAREKVGKMNNVWRDVLLLERRSNKVGID